MKKLFALLLVACVAHAVTLDAFIANYTTTGETVTIRELNTTANYAIMEVDLQETFLLNLDLVRFIDDPQEIEDALAEDALNNARVTERTEKAELRVTQFNSTGESWERLCMQWTGTDRFECDEFTSCQLGCISVPLCKNVMQGIGNPFINSIWEWRNASRALNESITQFFRFSSLLKQGEEPLENAENAEETLSQAQEELEELRQNDIFNCDPLYANSYCFCNTSYDENRLEQALEEIQEMHGDLAVLANIPARTSSIIVQTEERVRFAILKQQRENFQKLFNEAQQKLEETSETANESLALVEDEQITTGLESLESLLNDVRVAGSADNFELAADRLTQFHLLAKSIENKSAENKKIYEKAVQAYHGAALAIQTTNESLEPHDTILIGALENLSSKLSLLNTTLAPPAAKENISSATAALSEMTTKALAIEVQAHKKHELEEQLALENETAQNISSLARAYQQPAEFLEINSLLSQAHVEIQALEFAQAETTLERASVRITDASSSLVLKVAQIEEAKKEVEQARKELDSAEKNTFLFLEPDLKQARLLLTQAENIMYAEPLTASENAREAKQKAAEESQRISFLKPVITVAGLAGAFLAFILSLTVGIPLIRKIRKKM